MGLTPRGRSQMRWGPCFSMEEVLAAGASQHRAWHHEEGQGEQAWCSSSTSSLG